MKKICFSFAMLLLLIAVFSATACQKIYTLGPLQIPTATPVPQPPTTTRTFSFTPTKTATPTGTSTFTRTPTPSPTPPLVPGPYDYTCTGDTYAAPVSGVITIGSSQSFVPLCDGWILYGNKTANTVVALNVFTGAVTHTYSLSAAPGDLALDAVNGYLYCTLDSATFIARINLTTGVVSNIPISDNGDHLCVANNGMVFVIQGIWSSQTLALVNGISGAAVTTWPAPDVSFPVYNPLTDELFLGVQGTSPSALKRYTFSSPTTTLTQVQTRSDVGSNGEDIALSPDGSHLAFPVGSGNSGYVISDFAPSNILSSYGSWNTGAYPSSAGFSPDSQSIVASNGTSMMVFNVGTHVLSKQWTGTAGVGKVRTRFSKGGGYAYMMMSDLYYSPSAPSSILWGAYP